MFVRPAFPRVVRRGEVEPRGQYGFELLVGVERCAVVHRDRAHRPRLRRDELSRAISRMIALRWRPKSRQISAGDAPWTRIAIRMFLSSAVIW